MRGPDLVGFFRDKNYYRRNISVNYIYMFLQSFNITQGYWMIFLSSKGMNLIQLGILEGIFHATSFLMETPTGAIADIFGRKTSRILGRFFIMIYISIMLFGTSFAHFLIAFLFCAIGWNLESGAGDALVYDSLLEIKEEDRYMKVNGWLEVTYQIATAMALIIGGFIAVRSYNMLFSSQILIILSGAAAALLFKETCIGREHVTKEINIFSSLKNQYVDSIKIVKGNHRLIYMILLLNALGVFTTTSFFYMQIYCKNNSVNEWKIGIIFAISCVIGAIGGVSAHRIEKIVKERKLLLSIPIAIMLVMWGMIDFKTAIFSFMFLGFFDSILCVVYTDYINRLIPSSKRATLLSFSSMVFSFFMLLIFPVFGTIGEYFSMEYAFAFIAIVSTGLVIANIYILKRNKNNAND